MDQVIQQFLLDNGFDILLLVVLIIYRQKLVFDPLKGGNGVVQMDEAGKALILLVFYRSANAERLRDTEYNVFPDAYWYALLGAVILIAGLKQGRDLFNKSKEKEKEKHGSDNKSDQPNIA